MEKQFVRVGFNRIRFAGLVGIAVLVVAAATAAQGQKPIGTSGAAGLPEMASAGLVDANGRGVGQAIFQETPHGVLLTLELRNATPGVHGLHVHDVGRCDAPTFESAGGHFNPDRHAHGFLSPSGPHAGDLPNISVPASTELSMDILIPNVTLRPGPRTLLHANGSALVIHEGKDDYKTEMTGASGDRLACGVITGGHADR
jgi:Cu-Zn family superoxide dismutase